MKENYKLTVHLLLTMKHTKEKEAFYAYFTSFKGGTKINQGKLWVRRF